MRRFRATLLTAATATTLFLSAGAAHAGATCTVVRDDAPVYAGNNPWTEIVAWLDRGALVNATSADSQGMWRVAHPDTGSHMGYMRTGDVHCAMG